MGKKEWANFLLCMIILGVAGYGLHRIAGASGVVDLFNPEPRVSATAAGLEGKVTLDKAGFEINGVTKQVKASFTLTNNSRGPVNDVVISCDLRDRDGILRGRGRWVVYEQIEPSKTVLTVLEDRRYISYLVVPETISCEVVDLDAPGAVLALHHGDGH